MFLSGCSESSWCNSCCPLVHRRELASAALQQLAAQSHSEDASNDAPLVQTDSLPRLLPMLLPGLSRQHLEYAAAMLLPWQRGSGIVAHVSLGDLAAAAAECAAVEQRLQQQPANEAVRCLRQLSVALGSRSLDVAAAFGSADGQRLAFTELVSAAGVCWHGYCWSGWLPACPLVCSDSCPAS